MVNVYYCCSNRPTILLFILTCLIFLTLLHQLYQLIGNHEIHPVPRKRSSNSRSKHSTRKETSSVDNYNEQIDNLLLRIEDLKRIKLSVRNELREIEREKGKLLRDKNNLINRNEKLLAQIGRSKGQLKQLELDISGNRKQKLEQTCDNNFAPPILLNPLKSFDMTKFSFPNEIHKTHFEPSHYQTMTRFSFDLSKCPLSKGEFRFYLATQDADRNTTAKKIQLDLLRFDPAIAQRLLSDHRLYTSNQNDACLIISLIGDSDSTKTNFKIDRNNLIINLTNQPLKNITHQNIAFASANFASFRQNFDLLLPSVWQHPDEFDSIIGSMPPQSPINRKYLASYFGRGKGSDNTSSPFLSIGQATPLVESQLESLEKTLQIIHRNSIDDLFLFIYNCGPFSNAQCYEEKDKMIEQSVFTIIFMLTTEKTSTDDYSNYLVHLALSKGAIPVIIGNHRPQDTLPFGSVIDWRKATIALPLGRLSELHFILRTYSAGDLYQLKYHGRRIFESYLATGRQILDSVISVLAIEYFNYPPPAIREITTINYYPEHKHQLFDVNCTTPECIESRQDSLSSIITRPEILGPREKGFASQSYRRNYSLILNSAYDLWNSQIYSPNQLFPSYPIDPIPASEYKFLVPERGYRPIADGLGGSGLEFSRSLGGDYPNEQFTIVLLTYERLSLLRKTLERLKGLPYLNKILVVWNGVLHQPTSDMLWPDVGVPLVVVKAERNSLNNRFLPYDAIETDAIFSMDDDSPLRQDEIVFAFRVWRESRDRIVGFPGRYHAWDSNQNSWAYNSNHSCELSMVLTGGAFFHKYYSYIYTYYMPEAIHSIVDKFMNCEDIAMNFLVAHLTRKPPIKVTSRWTFHCSGCTSSLSEEDTHFRERHECLNTFASIYGYMPLLNTQHRSDSILFKTRLPQNKQKCFKYV